MSDLVERLRELDNIDGDIDESEIERISIIGDEAADELERLTAALAATERDNTHLRSALAVSKDPCRYCQLPAEEMAKCRSGFPGCDRADDMMGCPELGASLALQDAEIQAWNAAIEAAAQAAISKSADELALAAHVRYDEHEHELERAAFGRGAFIMKNFAATLRALRKEAP